MIAIKKLSDVDVNFKIKTCFDLTDKQFYDVKNEPFRIYGVFYEDGQFRRLPEQVAASVSPGVEFLHGHTAGGRVRFRTDSPYVLINAQMGYIERVPHMTLVGAGGFDLYAADPEERYIGSFLPPVDTTTGYDGMVDFGSSELREITVNFPLYAEVKELYIGLAKGAKLLPPMPYPTEGRIVYYGSSITQGGCASRPGNAYQHILTRRFGIDHLNLGFSGNAQAEDEIVNYMKTLSMTVFVLDYDHNAPTVEHLANTHERTYRAIREANPTLPIVMLSRPKPLLTAEEEERLAIVQATYLHAKKQGDAHIYMIDGRELMAMAGHDGTVDGCHPNDLGFVSMAKRLGELLAEILEK